MTQSNHRIPKVGTIIKLPSEVVVHKIKISEIEILSMNDNTVDKRVTIQTKGRLGRITLWEGEAYDAIGQWTDEDVKNRLFELYNNENK